LRACDLSEERVIEQLEEHADDPALADVVGETAREVFEALADAATVPLARLAKQYYGKKPPDWSSSEPAHYLHKPFGVQSLTRVIQDCDSSWRTRRTERRVSLPMLESRIDGPCGTRALSPARATMIPCGVSRHCAPSSTYQASGPECVWMTECMPGVKTASM